MKKTLFLGMIAAAGMLLAASCSEDELGTKTTSGDEAIVTFVLEQPGISTRTTYSDGLTATTLTYAVYEKDSKTPLINKEDAVTFTDKTATVSLNLVTGKSYDIIFWADAPVAEGGTNPYTFDAAAQTITVDYSSVASQDETRDAFFAAKTLENVSGTINETITLTRPFAQLNIGTTDATEAATAGFEPATSEVTVSNVYNTLNLLDGSVSNIVDGSVTTDDVSVTYAAAAIPSGEAFPVNGATYLSMNYLLVDSSKAVVDVKFTVADSDASHSIASTFTSVPVQRNYKTNIYGALLTDPAKFTIVINPEYEGNHNVEKIVSTTAELTSALADEEITYVTLSTSLEMTSEASITSDKTIDLNGNTLTTKSEATGSETTYGDIIAYEGSTLTIQDGTITQENQTWLVCKAGASIVIDNVTYSGTGWSCVYCDENAENTNITIRNSNITGGYYALSTNATTNPVGTTNMVLENSTFVADETAFILNIPSAVTATGCTFQGGWQAVFLRGGESTFTDCAFNLVMDPSYNDVPEEHHTTDGYWSNGNQAVTAALLIGNKCAENASGYDYPTTVTLENCSFSVEGTAYYSGSEYLTTAPSVYIWSRVEEANPTTLTYDAATYTNFEAAGSGSYVGNSGENLTVNGSLYSNYTITDTELPAVQ